MNYEEARQYIENASHSGISLGLSRMRELCRLLGNPEKKLRFIHIAGTNGKGSTAAFISSILAVNGHLTGRYVSPVVFQYEECIQYQEPKGIHYIDRELFARVVTETAEAVQAMKDDGWEEPTVFEIETAMAFLAFVHWQCSVVVLEVGLGGREDATNVIGEVLASVITPVSRDHMAMLGDTIEEIAAEKAGIIREQGRVITCQEKEEALSVIAGEAEKKKALLTVVHREAVQVLSADLEGTVFTYQGENFRIGMPGKYQVENAVLALETCRHLPEPFTFNTEQLMLGLGIASWRGRFEVVCTRPLIILDGAHNPAGAEALAESIRTLLSGRKLHGVMGVFADKEYETMVGTLAPLFEDVVTITPPGGRGLDRETLASVWKNQGCSLVTTGETVMGALKEAMNRCGEEDAILLFGSLSFFRELAWKQ
ncbi:MAG: bifunctional folylpolyglutamate synthase/dihydrofolate synthase [Lachnospiraceae bacterium]|nr:bifunctional folylpolyglutamate synthase/dihydrofolate synthase [Lachnospiraceae bacterium]